MATTLKVLGQNDSTALGAATDGDLYTVPAATSTVVSSISIANRTAGAITYIIKIRVAGAASAVKQHLASSVSIAPNSTDVWTLGITLATTDVITTQASAVGVTFQAFGQENT